VVAVAWSAAVYIHQRTVFAGVGPATSGNFYGDAIYTHPSWEDPAAVGIAIGGLAIAAGILTARRKTFAKPS
jgi:hypothetical protein